MPEVAVAVGSEVATDVSGEGALVAHEVAPSREVTPEVDDNDEGWEYEYHQLADSWSVYKSLSSPFTLLSPSPNPPPPPPPPFPPSLSSLPPLCSIYVQ